MADAPEPAEMDADAVRLGARPDDARGAAAALRDRLRGPAGGATGADDPLALLRGEGASWRAGLVADVGERLRARVAWPRGSTIAVGVVLALAGGIGMWALVLRPTPAPEPLPLTKARPTVTTTTGAASAPRAGTTAGSGAAPSPDGGSAVAHDGSVSARTGPGTTGPTMWVDVTGAVARPGLVALTEGARLAEAIAAAGGLAPDADRDRINLAGRVRDGERVFVPRRGEQAVPSVVAGAPAGGVEATAPSGRDSGGGAASSAPQAPATPIDLNTATAEQLDTLPGVGPATAAAIIDYRTQHGPFHSVDELDQVRGLGKAKVEQLRSHVRVGS